MTTELLEEWRLWQVSEALSPRTIDERIATMRSLARHTGADLMALTPSEIIRFCGRPGLSQTTRWTYHTSIRAFCRWMVKSTHRRDNPAKKTPRPKRPKSRPRPVSDTQLEALLARANRRRTRTYILLAALAGLRVHEIAKIRGEHISGNRLTVTGKGNSTWIVPLHPRLVEEAKRYPADGHWFPAYPTQRSSLPHVGPHAVSKAIRDTMRRAGFAGKPHQLRHWFGTALVSEGVDLGVVQKLMRHESPATTVIYADIRFGLQADGLSRIDVA